MDKLTFEDVFDMGLDIPEDMFRDQEEDMWNEYHAELMDDEEDLFDWMDNDDGHQE